MLLLRTCMNMPESSRHPLRQFSCCKHRWMERVPDENPYSKCWKCWKLQTAISKGEEVGVCKFECKCGNSYTVRCRMCDMAKCYQCKRPDVKPVKIYFRRRIRKKPGTLNEHSCSRCRELGTVLGIRNCPNLSC